MASDVRAFPWLAVTIALAIPGVVVPLRAAGEPGLVAPPTISDPVQIWALPTEQRSVEHPLQMEGRVAYVDARWRHLWLERDGHSSYLMLSPSAPALRQGQRVRFQGTILPSLGLDAAAVSVTVLPDTAPVEPLSLAGRVGDFQTLHNRIVTGSAYVDAQQLIDDDHVGLSLIVDDQPLFAYVKPANPREIPHWAGRFVSITALYQGRFDPTGTQATIELWTARQQGVSVIGSLAESRLFDLPVQDIRQLHTTEPGQRAKIRGRTVSIDPGNMLVVRDATGQVLVRSLQQQRVVAGSEVEAVGRVALVNAQWVLQSALFRVVADDAPGGQAPDASTRLESVEQIRALGVEEAAERRPVSVTGVVTWSMPGNDFFFFEDITGGIRVRFRPEQMPTPPRNKYLRIDGVTYNGGFAPAVELQTYQDLGAMSSPPVKTITFEQAITGQEDGQLVNMRGFYRATESDGDMRRIHVTTPGGEFIGLLKSSVDFQATPGSLLRVHGPCEVTVDENGRINGIMIRVPSLAGLIIEEDAPADPYALPLRSIKHLRQLNTARELTRVRVSGVVLHSEPGQQIYLQDAGAGLLLLSHDTTPLADGDRIEAVGMLGMQGVRTVLREAVYRKIGPGRPPAPVALADPARLSIGLDSRLVRVRGTLSDMVRRPDRLRLTLQTGSTRFDAVMDGPAADEAEHSLALGAGLELTGVYQIGFDDSRQSRSFQLLLRSPADIGVFRRARILTLPRAMIAAAVLAGCSLLAFAWVTALRRRVRRQTEQIRTQLERQAQLEVEVQHATRLESLGVLAGGLAHDFNNLLTIIMGNLGLAMLDERAMAAVGTRLRDCERGAARARDLTQQLLTFAKGGDPLRATVSLPDIVRETAEFVLRGSNCRCAYEIPGGLWSADADRAQVAQVVQNLVLNAKQAMPHGGIIRVSLHNDQVAAGANPALAAGRYLRLVITDCGQGIAAEALPRIFDPYFSTKKTGSGLGLATVYSIVRKHRGHIQVESAARKGATFTLWLPAAADGAACAEHAATARSAPLLPGGATARVLLMDDEEPIRRLGAAILERMNLEPTVVCDGGEAVREFEEARAAGRPFHLLILDLTIPGAMGGRDAIEQIRKLDPDVPAIVSSGYSNDPVLADFRRCGFQAMVTKPYEVIQLGETIRGVLAQRPVPASEGRAVAQTADDFGGCGL